VNVQLLQTKLNSAGCACLPDGALGPPTLAALLDYAASRKLGPLGESLSLAMSEHLPAYGVASDLGLLHWTVQACHQTRGFRMLDHRQRAERPAPGALEDRYGPRGIFPMVGREAYKRCGALIAEPLETRPDLAAHPTIAVLLAGLYWQDNQLQALADADNIEGVTRQVCGHLNDIFERKATLIRLKRLAGLL
jgi:putative chitinase